MAGRPDRRLHDPPDVHGEALGPAGRAPGDRDASSYLLLAGQPGRLVAEEVIRPFALPDGRAVGLAVLAGCRTGESARGFDDAFSIGTALLTAGVRTVISSQWSVPDGPTSILMFLLHPLPAPRGTGSGRRAAGRPS